MVHEPPNGHSTRPKSNQHLGLLSGGQNPGVTSKELPSGNHLIDFFNTSEKEIIINDAQNTGMDMRTAMTSIQDSESVIEPSAVEMQGRKMMEL